jgi:hypothetical protein
MPARHVVVDGSNMATEGSSLPSLQQLDEAVREYLIENPDDSVTVVVDATFGHRIPPEERKRFEQAELAGEIVSPPAGAIGRGDAFLLRVADKVGAVVLSNDSFQEFHGEYEWLFDKGRLMGGKPVPGVGWIFTPRTPVRGPKSRESVKEAKRKRHADKIEEPAPESGLDMAAERLRGHGGDRKLQRAIAAAVEEAVEPVKVGRKRRPRRRGSEVPSEPLNEPFSFITFIAAHQLGVEVEGTVDEFSSHGAFISVDGARCYVPLSAMSEVPPRSAREVLRKGERRVFVVQAFDAMRRGIELALPGFARPAGTPTAETIDAEIHRAEAALDIASEQPALDHPEPNRGVAKARGVSRQARKAISAPHAPPTEAARPTKAATKRAVGQPKSSRAAKRPAPAKAAAASGQPGDKVVANGAGVNKTSGNKAGANKADANKAAAKKTSANKAVAKKAVADKAVAKKAVAQEPTLKKSAALKAGPGPARAPVTAPRDRAQPSLPAVAKAAPAGRKSSAQKQQPAKKQPAKKQAAAAADGADGATKSSSTRRSQAAKSAAVNSPESKSAGVKTSGTGAPSAEKAPSARKRPAVSSTAQQGPVEKSRRSTRTAQNSRVTKTSAAKAAPPRTPPSAAKLTSRTEFSAGA